MGIEQEKTYRYLIRIFGTIALMITSYNEYVSYGAVNQYGTLLILFLYIMIIWVPKIWRSRTIYIILSIIIISTALYLHYQYGSVNSSLLWPLLFLSIFINRDYRYVTIIVSLVTITVIALVYAFSFGSLLAIIGIFLVVRSSQIRQNAHALTKLHLDQLDQAHRELQEAHLELQEASAHSVRYAALEERTRLAREIHDGLGHQLTSLIIQLQALEIMQSTEPEHMPERIKQLISIARQALTEVRIAVKEWSNDEMGLGLVALKGLITQTGQRSALKLTFVEDSPITEWSIQTSIVLYRVLQESLTNVLRHAQADTASVHIQEKDHKVYLRISDNGVYTDTDSLKIGYGLKNMKERCEQQGGTCQFEPVLPHGLSIQAVIPIGNPTQS
ncbi:signal transduction histidine kinase [Paenibacillus sp. SORGH_AS306]|uniref:sensor histidine kinase n=1 Tax=unclassified Paenibacillus TaxID=185978 RepID=UPI00278210C2|nr:MULTISPECIES: sensor histidine kinase [unclassified Paenibacillus]MDQ1237072.1 signal transduction histidine kinase [Paenibacillus sp. SORGH_AS_0306]MDR6109432.1 signal transduction histidine kinase [Paenibacillus sp. SORGH_AS_0338]